MVLTALPRLSASSPRADAFWREVRSPTPWRVGCPRKSQSTPCLQGKTRPECLWTLRWRPRTSRGRRSWRTSGSARAPLHEPPKAARRRTRCSTDSASRWRPLRHPARWVYGMDGRPRRQPTRPTTKWRLPPGHRAWCLRVECYEESFGANRRCLAYS